MPTVEELIVQAKPEGLDKTTRGFENMQDELDDTKEEMDETTGGLEDLAARWKGAMGVIVAGLGVAVAGLASRIPAVGSLMDQLSGTLDLLALKIDKALRPEFNRLSSAIADTNKQVAQADGPWEALTDAVTGVNKAFSLFRADVLQGVIKDLTGVKLPTSFLRFFTNLTSLNIAGLVQQFLEGLRNPEEVGRAVVDFGNSIASGINDAIIEPAMQWGKSVLDEFIGGLKNNISNLSQQIGRIANNISNGITNEVDNALDWGSNLIENLTQGFTNTISQLSTSAGAVADTISTEIDTLISDAISWGENIIDNLIQGLRNKVDDLRSEVDNIANTIDSRLNGNSPPPEGPLSDFDQAGPTLVETFAKGIQSSVSTAQGAANDVASSGGGGTGNPLNNPRVFIDGRDITQESGRYRRDETSRRGRNG